MIQYNIYLLCSLADSKKTIFKKTESKADSKILPVETGRTRWDDDFGNTKFQLFHLFINLQIIIRN